MGQDSRTPPRAVRFSVFELDLRSGELRRAGSRVPLQEQPRQLLIALLERPGELIARDELRHRLWPDDTFVDFEHGLNAAVKRLRETLGDAAGLPRFVETVPRRGYRFIAAVERDDDGMAGATETALRAPQPRDRPSSQAETPRRPWRRLHIRSLTALAGASVVIALAGAWLRRPSGETMAPATVVPFTLLPGMERNATFAPDDLHVAFAWNGGAGDNWDIYVKVVGSSGERRLTVHATPDGSPRWSPDGKSIAYLRRDTANRHQIRVMSPLGDGDRSISDRAVARGLAWTPDARYIAAAPLAAPGTIDLFPVDGGLPRRTLQVSPGEHLHLPAISPDGRALAYVSCAEPITWNKCDLYAIDLDEAFAARGSPRRLTAFTAFWLTDIAWMADGRSLVYGQSQPPFATLWRVRSDGRTPPARIEVAGIDAWGPSLSRAGDRLLFARVLSDSDVYRLDGGGVRPVAISPVFDSNPQLSPDGRQVAFCSTRSGDAVAVWVVDADGANPQRLTHGPGSYQCSPTWSPDGRRIAFDSETETGDWRIWTIDLETRVLRPLTTGPGRQNMPTWSRDGEWIYFSWDQGTGGRDIWRIHLASGATEQVTQGGGGLVARESADGREVYFQPGTFNTALLAQPLAGGAPRTLIPCVTGTAYSVLPAGVYYVPCVDQQTEPHPPVYVIDPRNGEQRQIGVLEDYAYGDLPAGFAVAPDGSTVFYARQVRLSADLMMIERFR